MSTERNILTAFILNAAFACFEFAGGVLTNSVAIISDAVHDMGDAVGIGVSYFLEKKSRGQPDETYTYGYARYSVLGGVFTTLILLASSAIVIYNAVVRMITPAEINYDGMIVFAVVGVCVNAWGAVVTNKGQSLNQKAVNLHMLEDVLGWAVVLVGAVVMKVTDIAVLDPILSVGVAVFIAVHSIRHLKEALGLFLEKAPQGVAVKAVKEHLCELDGVLDVHHIHLWSMDGHMHYATMHIVTDTDPVQIKEAVRNELEELGIGHAVLELEQEGEPCRARQCRVESKTGGGCRHHHH